VFLHAELNSTREKDEEEGNAGAYSSRRQTRGRMPMGTPEAHEWQI